MWNRSPAYDLVLEQTLLPSGSEELALTLNGKKRRLTAVDFAVFAAKLGIAPRQYERTLRRLTDRLVSSLDATLSSSFLRESFITSFRELLKEKLSVFKLA